MRDRRINRILEAIRGAVRSGQPISIEPKDVDYIRRSFHRGIALGERKLHELAHLFLARFAPGFAVNTELVVWGRCAEAAHKEAIRKSVALKIGKEELYATSDYLLSRQNAPVCPECGATATTIASFVHYAVDPLPQSGLKDLYTRIKTTSNICYKIADMVFDIDFMFQRDKIYNEFSQIVTDIYGIKAVLKKEEDVRAFLKGIREIPGVSVVEEKDYTGPRKKKSGFEAYKAVIKSDRQLFEIQIQSEAMYDTEQFSFPASHKTYKEHQMADRRKLGKEYVSLYQALTQLFAPPDQNYSNIDYIELGYSKKGLDDEF